jgi:hypothetical protein
LVRAISFVLQRMTVLLPRSICASADASDNLWTSTTVVVSSRQSNIMYMQEQCHVNWSPGMVLYICPGTVDPSLLTEFASRISVVGQRLGKARRITSGTPMARDVVRSLYQSFYCVEFVNLNGSVLVVDDGNEAVAQADILPGKNGNDR